MAQGFVLNISKQMLDRLDVADAKIKQLATTSEQAQQRIVAAFQQMSTQGVQAFINKLQEAQRIMGSMGATNVTFIGMDNLSSKSVKAVDDVNKLATTLTQLHQTMGAANAPSGSFGAESIAQTTQITKEMTKEFRKGSQWFNKLQEAASAYEQIAGKLAPTLEKARQAQRDFNEEAKRTALNDVGKLTAQQGQAKTLNELKMYANELKRTMANLDPKSKEWERLNNIYKQTNREIKNINKSMSDVQEKQKSLINTADQLKRAFGLAFSVSAIKGYITQIARVRGEFELQQRSLQAILQNKDAADRIWAQTVKLAVRSPFQVKELVTYTKQLAAYRVESSKLFETTKMLADVSAGLGVDMQRLILAFGQVKAANYLRGTELRQFSEAGINILGELAKYYTEIEGSAVTVNEVFERVSKRMVTFGDVEEIFERITGTGGIFYNMQEIQAETLKGQLSNLRDAVDIMLNDIGKAHEGTMKTVVSIVRVLVQNWELVAVALKGVILTLSLVKLNSLLASENVIALAKSFGIIATVDGVKALKVTQLLNLGFTRLVATLKSVGIAMKTLVIGNPWATAIMAIVYAVYKLGSAWWEHKQELKEIDDKYRELGTSIKELSNQMSFAKSENDLKGMKKQLSALIEVANRDYNLGIKIDTSELNEGELVAKFIEIRDKIFDAQEFAKSFEVAAKQVANWKPDNYDLFGDLTTADNNISELFSTLRKAANETAFAMDKMGDSITKTQSEALKTLQEPQGIDETQFQYVKRIREAFSSLTKDYQEALTSFYKKAGADGSAELLKKEEARLKKIGISVESINQMYNMWDVSLSDVGDEADKLFDKMDSQIHVMDSNIEKERKIKVAIDKLGLSDVSREIMYFFANQRYGINITPIIASEEKNEEPKKNNQTRRGGAVTDWTGMRISLLKEMNKEYENLSKTFSADEAEKKVADAFKKRFTDAFKYINLQMSEINFTTEEGLLDALNNDKIQNAATKGGKKAQRALEKAISEVQIKIGVDAKQTEDEKIKTELDDLFEKYEITADLSKLGISPDFMKKFFDFDAVSLDTLKTKLEELKPKFVGKDMENEYQQFVDKVTEIERKAQEERLKTYLQYARNSVGERAKIKLEELNKLAEIEKTFTKPEQKQEKEAAQKAVKEESYQATQKLEWEEFQKTDTFINLFKDLDSASSTLINHTIKKLNEFKEQWKNMPLEDMRSIVQKVGELENALVAMNPFQAARDLRAEGVGKKGNVAALQQEAIDTEQKLLVNEQEIALYEEYLRLLQEGKQEQAMNYAIELNRQDLLGETEKTLGNEITTRKSTSTELKKQLATTNQKLSKEKQLANAYKAQADAIGDVQKMANDLIDSFSELAEVLGADSDGIGMTFVNMGQDMMNTVLNTIQLQIQLQATTVAAEAMGAAMNTAMGIVGWIVMAVQLLVQLLTAIFQAKDKALQNQIEALAKSAEDLQEKFDELADSIDEVYSTDALAQTNKDLQENNKLLLANLKAQKALQQERKQTDKVKDEIEDLNDQIKEAEQDLIDAQKEVFSHATDGILDSAMDAARGFVDAWYDAFTETGDGMKGLEENFEEMLLNMLKQQATLQIMQPFIDDWIEELKQYIDVEKGDTKLTTEEARKWAESVKEDFPGLSAALEALFKSLDGIVGGDGTLSGLEQEIGSMSEETAQILAAYLNSIRFFVSENNAVLKQLRDYAMGNEDTTNPMLAQLRIIAQQTAAINSLLNSVTQSGHPKGQSGIRVFVD